MSAPPASLHEVARFLSGFAPFDALAAGELDALAASATIEFAGRGEEIFGQGLAGQVADQVVVKRLYEVMMQMSAGLGVNCTYCHNSRAFYDWGQSLPARWPVGLPAC